MRLVIFLLAVALGQECFGQSAASYAAKMNGTGGLRHDPNWRGAEVVFRSSGIATEAEARRWWMNSPRHRALLVSGAITDIACVGNVCVGRGTGSAARSVQVERQRLRIRFRR